MPTAGKLSSNSSQAIPYRAGGQSRPRLLQKGNHELWDWKNAKISYRSVNTMEPILHLSDNTPKWVDIRNGIITC